MTVELMHETWPGRILTVTIGATPAEGGTRSKSITVGGHGALPFMTGDAPSPHPPVVALEVLDMVPDSWPEHLRASLADVLDSPAAWARKGVEELGADLICLRLASPHPEARGTTPDEAARTVRSVLDAVSVPLIILGCGDPDVDNDLWPRITQEARGERCLMGVAVPENYKTLVVACLADGHMLLAEAPIDVNIQKQLTILATEMGLPADRIVLHPGTASLGYGLEYEYSIMERIRLAGLQGDRMLSQPVAAIVGEESWKAKEARLPEAEMPVWGSAAHRGPTWEAATAAAYLQAGTDIVVLLHPEALGAVKRMIGELTARPAGAAEG
jgi:acetyl-CoA decarbonylase/synthase, CODH/ACS complex subunit delta